jgi:chromosome segregation protein
MFLKQLEMTGFKSFARPVRLELERGITAVVGPNGSGKSNIVDAVRWVLGEQSARALRGAKGEDVIFGGSGTRHALGMAEVTLVLDNTDGRVDLDVAEVALARRLYRSGETEYLLNRRRARLRDVLDAAGQAGLGPDSYCVVGQGTIEQLVLQRPQERRGLIADAADVRRHEARLAEIESDLVQTQQSSLRMSAAATEIRPQLDRLRAQAERADRHHRVRDETGRLARAWFTRALPAARAALAAGERRRAGLHADIDLASTRLTEVERRRASVHADIRAARERVREIESRVVPARRALEDLRIERAAIAERLASGESRLTSFKSEENQLATEIGAAREAAARSAEALHQAQTAATDAAAGQAAAAEASARVAAARRALQDTRAQLDALQRDAAQLAARVEQPPLSSDLAATAPGREARVAAAVEQLARCLRELGDARSQIDVVAQRTSSVRDELSALGANLSTIEDRLSFAIRSLGELTATGRRGQAERPASAGSAATLSGLAEVAHNPTKELAEVRRTIETQRATVDAAERALQDAMEAQAVLSSSGAVAQERLARLTEAHDRDVRDLQRLERRAAEITSAMDRLRTTTAEQESRRDALAALLSEREAAGVGLEQEASEAAAAVAAQEAAAERVDAEYREAQIALADARTDEAAAGAQAEHARAAVDHLEMELAAAAEALVVDQAELLRSDVTTVDLAPLDDAALHARLERSQRELRSLGSVDYGVLAEFGTLRDRYAFLTEQLDDLARAEAEIRQGMAEVRERIQQQFATAFADVNERFKERFRELFSGGDAELVLAGDAENSQSGVDIVAQPPGKRLHRLATLSGGERALVGAALLLALIGANPSPFCILDEVDAALDEANVQRFAGTIREMAAHTQFILVTHNRATMEMADALYGVTMTTGAVSQILAMRLDD